MTPTIRTFSCGAGVQSTTIALLIRDGRLPLVDHVIFADTGWEPARVYAQVDRLAALFGELGVPFHRVARGNLRRDAVDPAHRFASVPYFVRNPDGSEGMGRRQCTSEYKLAPINRKVRELLGAAPPDFRRVPAGRVAEQWIGFSADEWRELRDEHPAEWADAVEFDRLIRRGGARGLPLDGQAFLHRSRVPLDEAPIDRWTRGDVADATAEAQGDLFDLLEDGDPDGCSPYGCRSGREVA